MPATVAAPAPSTDAGPASTAGGVVIRPIAGSVPLSVNQTLPSGPGPIPYTVAPGFSPELNSMISPAVVIRPIASIGSASSVNQRAPSGPPAMKYGQLPVIRPAENLVICPAGVTRPISAPGQLESENHTFPSAPGAIPYGLSPGSSPALNSVI